MMAAGRGETERCAATYSILSLMIENQTDSLSFPHPVLPGALIMAFRDSRLREIGMLSYRKERKTSQSGL